MSTDKNKNHISETFIIPTDVMLEIAQIILQADLPHEIIGIKENKSQIIMEISYQPDLKFHQEAIKNIVDIVKDYHELCCEEHKETNWREGD